MTEPESRRFTAPDLYGSVIALPLLAQMQDEAEKRQSGEPPRLYRVVIDLNLNHANGREAAARQVRDLVQEVGGGDVERVDNDRNEILHQYIVARLTAASIQDLVRVDRGDPTQPSTSAIYRIWPDFKVRALINKSVATVKADAARTAFSATGAGIVWAVVDSGIQGDHRHFQYYDTLDVNGTSPVAHQDFIGGKSPLTDEFGHGTHVAGIIAGATMNSVIAYRAELDHNGDVDYVPETIPLMPGMAPACRLVSYKVLDERGDGETSAIMAALQDIQRVNSFGRDIKIHGVNLSVEYPFDPKWFACGASPLCVEVDRLVKAGVVVVVAAGNTGYGYNQDAEQGNVAAGMDLTINDPGNAALAITVGSTHRDMPHRYGVSYFSSKGPTGDGRAKPDLVAPGERILSCAAGETAEKIKAKPGVDPGVEYVEDSGTSMAAAHVSGVIAAFLSIRPEYIGQPEEAKRIFVNAATDLGRVSNFQGRGLVDLMRAIQSV
jgi:subtilisin family serine protease